MKYHELPNEAFGPVTPHVTDAQPVPDGTVVRLQFDGRRPSTVMVPRADGVPDWTRANNPVPIIAYQSLQWPLVQCAEYLSPQKSEAK